MVARAFFSSFLSVPPCRMHLHLGERAFALPPCPPWNPQHQGPGGLGPSIPSI